MENDSEAPQIAALPTEIWRLVADHMSTEEWARASGTCRSMAAVLPRRITLRATEEAHFIWIAKHWADAAAIKLGCEAAGFNLEDTLRAWLEEYHQGHRLKLQSLDMNLTQIGWLLPDTPSERYDPDYFLNWLCEITEHAPKLTMLRLVGMSIGNLPVLSQLKHLLLDIDGPPTVDVCHYLQQLASLETLNLVQDSGADSDMSELDLSACHNLRAVLLCGIVVEDLQVPNGCLVSFKGGIAVLTREWWHKAGMTMTNGCYLSDYRDESAWDYDDEALPDMSRAVACLSDIECHRLTTLSLDCLKLCSWDCPIEIGVWLKNLQHLHVASESVHMYFTAPVKLRTLLVIARQCVTHRIISKDSRLMDALTSSLTRVHFRWRCCCQTTYRLLGHLRKPCTWREGWGWSEVCMPASAGRTPFCSCGACWVCLQAEDRFLP